LESELEAEGEIESEIPKIRRVSHNIEAIGTVRAANGTALETIAGAAVYWQERAIELAKASKGRWRDGFLTGSISTAIFATVFILCYRFFT